ncbi:MAG: hypothetical protein AB7V42_15420 [Thermoleophilia bacterium]
MLVAIAVPIALYAFTAAVIAAVQSVRGIAPDRTLVGMTVLLEAALVVQALVVVGHLVAGHDLSEPVPFFAYLVGSVLALPAAALWARRESDRWDTAMIGLVCLAIGVIVLRLLVIW